MRRLLPVLVLLAGCLRDPSGLNFVEKELGVYSVVMAGTDSLFVQIVEHPTTGQSFEPNWIPISGATVWIAANSDSVRLTEVSASIGTCIERPPVGFPPAPAGSGCYVALMPGGVRSETDYRLNITLADGRRVHGAVRTPATPALLAPRTDTTIVVRSFQASVPVAWSAPNAGALQLAPVTQRNDCYVAWENRDIGGAATLSTKQTNAMLDVVQAGCFSANGPTAWTTLPVNLVLVAYDSAYGRYLEGTTDHDAILRTRAQANLEGAVGFFAGAARDSRRVVFVNGGG